MKIFIPILLSLLTLQLPVDSIEERTKLLDQLFETIEAEIANPAWLDTESYRTFKEKMYAPETLALEDKAFRRFFNQETRNLPFTHLYIWSKQATSSSSAKDKRLISWKALNENVAYLDVRTFSSDAEPMAQALQEIGYDQYDHLIIDLRGNPGGTLDAPVVLGRFLTDQRIDAGVYLTRRWFEEKGRPATPEDIATFPFLQEFTYEGIGQMFAEEAAFRMVIPGHEDPIFQGQVYVLVNQNTGSACEPLIDVFQQEGLATLVGERSGGAMLSGAKFPINVEYRVFLPIADYQTADGRRLDKVGVGPDVEVNPEEALDHVLHTLIGNRSSQGE